MFKVDFHREVDACVDVFTTVVNRLEKVIARAESKVDKLRTSIFDLENEKLAVIDAKKRAETAANKIKELIGEV